MVLENNNVKFVSIYLTEEDKKEINLKNVYVGKGDYIMTTTEAAYDKLMDYLKENYKGDFDDIYEIQDVDKYIYAHYDAESYDIFGVTGYFVNNAEDTKEKVYCAMENEDFDYERWENEIDRILKRSIINSVSFELKSILKKLNDEGFDLKPLAIEIKKYF